MNEQSGKSGASAHGKYLTFRVSKERYGFDILKVQEIIKVTQITKVPRCPSYIKGVINLRGKIIPVIDLRLKFGIEEIPYDNNTCIIVLNVEFAEQRLSVGVVVDTVLDVIDFLPEEIEPSPDYGRQLDTRFLLGLGKKSDQMSILVDIERVLQATETSQVAALSQGISV